MVIKTENYIYELSLRTWEGSRWSQDYFAEIEDSIPPCSEEGYGDMRKMTEKEINALIDYWEDQVESANAGLETEQFGKNEEGHEYLFDYCVKEKL